ncbi:MAG: 3-dehydroquinate synthase [Chitinophagaceae bacterium]|nr:3-dehydroquinate synthase [Chitinophagaceae bacterium]
MKHINYKFSATTTGFWFDGSFSYLKKIVDQKHAVIITDENVYDAHSKKFNGWNTIVLKAGEDYKVQATVDAIIEELIAFEADRKATLIGIGGGVVTDITGYVASVYMRGIAFGFIPTSLLALVDASIGGKNGIDVGVYKNMVGVIRQPSFILHDMSLLSSLPQREWENGFAEIIKHACIKDAAMFRQLEANTIASYQKNKKAISDLVRRNAIIKIKVVKQDEFEKGDRRLLNFGHTLGHALENQYELMHGQAVAIGMAYASVISEEITGFKDASRVARLLLQYDLPTFAEFDKKKVFNVMKMDKKREKKEMNYILLEKIGKGVVKPIPVKQLENIINELQ